MVLMRPFMKSLVLLVSVGIPMPYPWQNMTLSRCEYDVAFIGTNGISASFGLSTPDPDEAAVKSAIVRAARRVVVVADAEKLGRELLVSFAPLDAIDVLVTDAAPDAELTAALSDAEVEVWLA